MSGLHDLLGAPGPTFTLIYAAFRRLFVLELPWLRLSGLGLTTACLALVFVGSAPLAFAAIPGIAQPCRHRIRAD